MDQLSFIHITQNGFNFFADLTFNLLAFFVAIVNQSTSNFCTVLSYTANHFAAPFHSSLCKTVRLWWALNVRYVPTAAGQVIWLVFIAWGSLVYPGCVKSRKNLGRWWASPEYERFCINIVIIKSTWKELLFNIGFHLPLSNITNTFHTAWPHSGLLRIYAWQKINDSL